MSTRTMSAKDLVRYIRQHGTSAFVRPDGVSICFVMAYTANCSTLGIPCPDSAHHYAPDHHSDIEIRVIPATWTAVRQELGY